MLRYKYMVRKFCNLAYRAASQPKCTLLVDNTIDMLSKQVEEEMNGVASPIDPITAPTNVTPPIELLSIARLKKKEVETKTWKHKRTWLDKRRKFAKREKIKKKILQSRVTRKKAKFRRHAARKKEKVQRYMTMQKYNRFSLVVFIAKNFNCI